MTGTLIVEFSGPLSWAGQADAPSIFDDPLGAGSGVYLWTVASGDSELIYYVGETGRQFSERMREHFMQHCSGGYHLYSPDKFARGMKDCLWPGRYDPSQRKTVADFLERGAILWPAIYALAKMYRFFLATMELDHRYRKRIEAAIAQHLYAQSGIVGEFQDGGIRYSPRRDNEPAARVLLRCSRTLLGLPEELSI